MNMSRASSRRPIIHNASMSQNRQIRVIGHMLKFDEIDLLA
jgi:hypothetical protein